MAGKRQTFGQVLREARLAKSITLRNFAEMVGISPTYLSQAGITTIAEVERLGPVVAYSLVKQHQPKASLNLLWAMAAGLKGKGWQELSEATKKRLRKEADA